MAASLRHMLSGVFDYAGLFPPATLDMATAADHYARHQSGAEQWIVNRFVCPVHRLGELLSNIPGGKPWGIACLGTSLAQLEEDRKKIEEFERDAKGSAVVECYEVKSEGEPTRAQLRALAKSGFEECFVELPWDDLMLDGLLSIAEAESVGAKARTGGLQAAAYPSCDDLAAFLQECLNLDLRHKLTAGLHHPFRFFDRSVGGPSHGFLNVICAGVLAEEHDLSRVEMSEILADESPDSFEFRDDGLEWRGLQAEVDAIDDYRELFAAIGSCSIQDPLDDLKSNGLEIAVVAK